MNTRQVVLDAIGNAMNGKEELLFLNNCVSLPGKTVFLPVMEAGNLRSRCLQS
jgi:hypothetical protein